MHSSAWLFANLFFTWYKGLIVPTSTSSTTIVDVGSGDYNGNLRTALEHSALSDTSCKYIGVDLSPGPNVDVVLHDPYGDWPFEQDSVDIIVSNSALEHDKFFWMTFLRMSQITKPGGLMMISVPSELLVHRYPVDNWRFLADSGNALTEWAQVNGEDLSLVYNNVLDNAFKNTPDNDYKRYSDVFMIFYKGKSSGNSKSGDTTRSFSTKLNKAETITSSRSSVQVMEIERVTNHFNSITASFLRNVQRLAQLAGQDIPSATEVMIQGYPTSILEETVHVPDTLLQWVNCWFKINLQPLAPAPPAGSDEVYITVDVAMQLTETCVFNRGLVITRRALESDETIQSAISVFAQTYGIPTDSLTSVANQLVSGRKDLLTQLQDQSLVLAQQQQQQHQQQQQQQQP